MALLHVEMGYVVMARPEAAVPTVTEMTFVQATLTKRIRASVGAVCPMSITTAIASLIVLSFAGTA